MQIDAKKISDAFKHIPDLFWVLRDRKTLQNTQNLKKLKSCPEKDNWVCQNIATAFMDRVET